MRRTVFPAAGAILAAVGLLSGCHRPDSTRSAPGSPNAPAAAPQTPVTPDLARPFDTIAWMSSGSSMREPLTLGASLARSAGGGWIVYTRKPLDDMKWYPQYEDGSSGTVAKTIEAIRKANTPLFYDTSKGYGILCFGPESELKNLLSSPPTEVLGLCLIVPNGERLIHMVGDFFGVKAQRSGGRY